MSENELTAKCLNTLFDAVGPVETERFVYILNRDNSLMNINEFLENIDAIEILMADARKDNITRRSPPTCRPSGTSRSSRTRTVGEWTNMKDVAPAEKNDYKFRKVTVDLP